MQSHGASDLSPSRVLYLTCVPGNVEVDENGLDVPGRPIELARQQLTKLSNQDTVKLQSTIGTRGANNTKAYLVENVQVCLVVEVAVVRTVATEILIPFVATGSGANGAIYVALFSCAAGSSAAFIARHLLNRPAILMLCLS